MQFKYRNIQITCFSITTTLVDFSRLYKNEMLMHFADIGKRPPTFDDASRVAIEILKSSYEYDVGQLFFNVFKYLWPILWLTFSFIGDIYFSYVVHMENAIPAA